MRLRFALVLLTLAPSAFAETPSSLRWDCVFPDKSMKVTVEAPDKAAADKICIDKWKLKLGKAATQGVEDDVFSRRSLLN